LKSGLLEIEGEGFPGLGEPRLLRDFGRREGHGLATMSADNFGFAEDAADFA
jgi:hypothetical protein